MTLPPLLAIAEGRRARPRRAPLERPKEIALQMQVAALLRKHAKPLWRWSHFPAGERRDARTSAKLRAMGLRKGFPDFILISPQGVFHGIELKRRGGVLSEEQKDFQTWAIARGVPHSVAQSMDDVRAVLEHWGALNEL
jgi:hypothetical protein